MPYQDLSVGWSRDLSSTTRRTEVNTGNNPGNPKAPNYFNTTALTEVNPATSRNVSDVFDQSEGSDSNDESISDQKNGQVNEINLGNNPGNPNALGYFGAVEIQSLDLKNPQIESRLQETAGGGDRGGASIGFGFSAGGGFGPIEGKAGATWIAGGAYKKTTVEGLPTGSVLVHESPFSSIVAVWELPDGRTANELRDGTVFVFEQQAETFVDGGGAGSFGAGNPAGTKEPTSWKAGFGATFDVIQFVGAPSDYAGGFTTNGVGLGLIGLSFSYTDDAKHWTDFVAINLHLGPQAAIFREYSTYVNTGLVVDSVSDFFLNSRPIVLDLDGNGIRVVELSESTVFMDATGDGYVNRTAWADVGDGVLFYDPDNTGQITETRQYVFTEWDPTASSDLEALRSVFDSNGEGVFDSNDADWANFKVMVTQADGTSEAKTLTEVGIVSIDRTPDATQIEPPDGSVITALPTMTMTDSTTRDLADMVLVAEADGVRREEVERFDGAGVRTLVQTGYNADGTVAFKYISVATADGSAREVRYDDDGDGVVHRLQSQPASFQPRWPDATRIC